MPFTPVNGNLAKVTFTPTAGTLVTGIHNYDWNKKNENRTAEVTNALSGGVVQRIAGNKDSSGTFNVVLDSTATPESLGVEDGATGLLKLYYTATKFRGGDVIIKSVDYKAVVRGGQAIEYAVSWEGSGLFEDGIDA